MFCYYYECIVVSDDFIQGVRVYSTHLLRLDKLILNLHSNIKLSF